MREINGMDQLNVKEGGLTGRHAELNWKCPHYCYVSIKHQ